MVRDGGPDLAVELGAAKTVLCVQPHYDDNDIGAGGTIAALSDAGAAVHYLTVADDLLGVLDATLPDDAAIERLEREQREAARHIGVTSQRNLRLPDAGDWDVVALRTSIVEAIRRTSPDYVFTCDPWLPNEAHRDHTRTGVATAEAVLLHALPRVRTTPEVDAAWRPHAIRGLVLYFTARPNVAFDIGGTRERKHRALDAYRAQFTDEGLTALHRGIGAMERRWADGSAFSHAEGLRLLRPHELHVGLAGSGPSGAS